MLSCVENVYLQLHIFKLMFASSLTIFRRNTIHNIPNIIILRKSSDISKFKQDLASAKNIAFLSGAGISSESGIPTFRGPDGYWRKYSAVSLATPAAFRDSPSLVWEFYHHRREVAAKAQPNQVATCIFELGIKSVG